MLIFDILFQPRKPNTFWEAFTSKIIPRQLSVPYARNNGQFIMFSIFLAMVNISLFVSRAIEYRNFMILIVILYKNEFILFCYLITYRYPLIL